MTRWITLSSLVLLAGCKPATPPAPGTTAPPARAPVAAAPAEPAPAPAPEPDRAERPAPRDPAPAPTRAPARAHGEPNRLARETSPYLLQHAYNPVDWYPWGPEAFERARREDKPIFLSIGYSTCYWCHVMERESFEDPEIATRMNASFICIKVDREERPDVDDIYMAAVRYLNRGRGGWPMSSFLDPHSLKPFFGGTYYPKSQFESLMNDVVEQWTTDRATAERRADTAAISVARRMTMAAVPQRLSRDELDKALSQLQAAADQVHGGFKGGRNKFPLPSRLRLLMGADWDNGFTQEIVKLTLDRMAMGGMYDQIGGGFHRYSTDQQWLVPHFEKMLYDNGQLAGAYAEAYELTGDPFYAEIVRETLDYVLREMTGGDGRFYSAQDAEVNAREGGSYVWTADEVRSALQDAGHADLIGLTMHAYGLGQGTNFKDPHHPDDPKNVLHLVTRPDRLAAVLDLTPDELADRLRTVNAALLAVRDQRDQPLTDDKMIVSWNGLMITGMADGGRVLQEPAYVEAARRALDFILTHMPGDDGGLRRTYREGRARIDANLVDYAYLIQGVLALHRATDDADLLALAVELAERVEDSFADPSTGGYFDTLAGREDLFLRGKTVYDGARPSGNSVMLHDLMDLFERTGDPTWLERASTTLAFMSGSLKRGAANSTLAALGLHRFLRDHPSFLPGGTAAPVPATDPVVFTVSADEITVPPPGGEAALDVNFVVAPGYHINAADPGHQALIGMRFITVGGGVEVEAAFPEARTLTGPMGQTPIRVYEGTFTVPLKLRQTGAAISANTRLMVFYQVCTDRACMAPGRDPVPVEISIGR